jgi:hypothetical protein
MFKKTPAREPFCYSCDMNKLLRYLESYQPIFQYAQIATGGSWETALRLDSDDQDAINHLTKTADESIVGELMYRLNNDRIAFLGIRYSASFAAVSSPGEFIMEFARAARTAQGHAFATVMADVSRSLTGSDNAFAESDLSFAEVGVVDNWKSMGSVVVPRDLMQATSAQLQNMLRQKKSLLANSKNHIAVELAFKDPAYWVGIQISEIVDDQYTTNLDTIKQVLATV